MTCVTRSALQTPSIEFTFAVDALEKTCRGGGRAIWTGIGKAGLIARYGSSLLSSAAMESAFLSAGEATHGDMGMIGQKDALIVLSHSGASSEPLAVVEHAKWLHRVPIIAITSDPDSPIANNADMALIYQSGPEVLGHIPARASLQQMAVCNELVIETAKRLGRDEIYWGARHPGGSIGAHYRKGTNT